LSGRAVHWFRNDLRLRDNPALAAAATAGAVATVFVIDPRLVEGQRVGPPRLHFLEGCLERLSRDLEARGHTLLIRRGDPAVEIPRLLEEARADLLTFNRDSSPYARARDLKVERAAGKAGVRVRSFGDRAVFESGEIRTGKGEPFRVYTPFRNACLRRLREAPPAMTGNIRLPDPLRGLRSVKLSIRGASGIDVKGLSLPTPGEAAARRRLDAFLGGPIARYHEQRDVPAVDGTSRLSPYLRLGAISIRACLAGALEVKSRDRRAARGARTWIDELLWREFYQAILAEYPRVMNSAFRPEYDGVRWNDDDDAFEAWSQGRTGFPFVDAGMRQLAGTGWMHNRLRMIVASFLTKDLLIDWRRGERFFMQRLIDGDPASNNGGWQWAASTGTDAQPYFRIFNPFSQSERFDPEGDYIRRHVPELAGLSARDVHRPAEAARPPKDYPLPIVDHAERREEAIHRFKSARGRSR